MNLREFSSSCYQILLFVFALTLFLPKASCYPYMNYEIPDSFEIDEDDNSIDQTKRSSSDGRNLSLCPGRMSKIQCIHSYLELYAKMQSGMTDPMSLRNIGKRSRGYDKKGALMCPPNMDKIECYDNAISYYIRVLRMMSSKKK